MLKIEKVELMRPAPPPDNDIIFSKVDLESIMNNDCPNLINESVGIWIHLSDRTSVMFKEDSEGKLFVYEPDNSLEKDLGTYDSYQDAIQAVKDKITKITIDDIEFIV